MSNYSSSIIRIDNTTFIQPLDAIVNGALIPILSIIGGTGVIATGIWSCLPRIKDRDTLKEYINYEENTLIKEKQYKIFWGRFFFKKLKMMSLPKETEIELSYTPLTGATDGVPDEVYTNNIDKKNKRVITIIDTTFFKNAETDTIFIREICKMSDPEYKSKITPHPSKNDILVTNENTIEIRRFPVEIPDFDLEQIPNLLKYGELGLNPYEYADHTFQSAKLFVTIPAKEGNNIGKKTIELRKKIQVIPS